jgi:diaminopimelate decarboxylase
VAVRVNPDFELKGSGMKMGGGPKQFGVDVEVVPQMLAWIAREGLAFEGFHLFAGSQNLRAESICDAQQKSYALALRLAEHAPHAGAVSQPGGWFWHSVFSRASSTWTWLPSVPIWRTSARGPNVNCRKRMW